MKTDPSQSVATAGSSRFADILSVIISVTVHRSQCDDTCVGLCWGPRAQGRSFLEFLWFVIASSKPAQAKLQAFPTKMTSYFCCISTAQWTHKALLVLSWRSARKVCLLRGTCSQSWQPHGHTSPIVGGTLSLRVKPNTTRKRRSPWTRDPILRYRKEALSGSSGIICETTNKSTCMTKAPLGPPADILGPERIHSYYFCEPFIFQRAF